VVRELEHAEHDGADKGECDISGNNAQSAGQSHGKPLAVHVAARSNARAGKPFQPEKSALLSIPISTAKPQATWLKIREINPLKSR
jgi:hypothetical protein